MTTLKDAQRIVNSRLGTKQDLIPWKAATLGDGKGTVSTGNNMCYVRLSENSSVIEVLNLRCAPVDGLRVRIAKTPEMPLVWQVIGQDDQRADENGNGTGGGSNYSVGPHHLTHEYLGVDQVNIDWRQINNLRVYATSGLIIGVVAGLLPRPGADLVVPSQYFDLTSHVPVSGALYCLISIDSTGALIATDGAAATSPLTLTLGDIPDTPAGNFRLAAVRLYAGQTAISESTVSNDIRDLRWPQERLASTFETSVIGSGTIGRLAQFTAASTIGDSTLIKTGAGVLTLTAGGAYNLTVPATGTALLRDANIAAGRVAFGSDANTLSGDSGLLWDNVNKRLGINKSPTRPLDVQQTADTSGIVVRGYDDRSSDALSLDLDSSGFASIASSQGFRFIQGTTNLAFVSASNGFRAYDGVPFTVGNDRDYGIVYSASADTLQIVDGNTVDTNVRITLNSTGQVGIGATPATLLHVTLNNSTTNAIESILTVTHNTTGTAANGLGGSIALNLESSTAADQAAAAINWLLTTATHAILTTKIALQNRTAAGALTDRIAADGAAITLTGSQHGSYATTAINLTLTSAHHWVTVTAAVTITLPTAASITGREYIISATAAGVIVDGDGTETINGYASWTMSANSTMQVKSDGANWIII